MRHKINYVRAYSDFLQAFNEMLEDQRTWVNDSEEEQMTLLAEPDQDSYSRLKVEVPKPDAPGTHPIDALEIYISKDSTQSLDETLSDIELYALNYIASSPHAPIHRPIFVVP
ncbi:MAG: hypothetical protein HPY50_19875 [Firmicutes bacterium]|nr:hypothetical protein [Bacillota bacterium]